MKTTILDYVNNIINDVNKTHFYEFDKSTANNIFRPGYQFYTWMQFYFLSRSYMDAVLLLGQTVWAVTDIRQQDSNHLYPLTPCAVHRVLPCGVCSVFEIK